MPAKKQKKRSLNTYIAVIPAVLLVVFIVYLVATPPSPTLTTTTQADLQTVRTGEVAKPFTLNLIDGSGLKDQKISYRPDSGNVVLIDFIHEWCVHCRNMAPIIERLHENYGSKVTFITVAGGYNTNAEKTAEFIRNYRIGWTVGFDPQLEVFRSYGVRGTPTYFIIDRNGVVSAKLEGEQTYDAIAQVLDRLLR